MKSREPTRRQFLWRSFGVIFFSKTCHLTATQLIPTLRERRFDIPHVDAYGGIVSWTEGTSTYFVEELGDNITLEMTRVPSGSFLMGSDDKPEERPIHAVNVPEFFLGTFEITRGQWRTVSTLPKVRRTLSRIYPLPTVSPNVERHLPIDGVRFHEANEFCERLKRATGRSYRLPSESEWEYACRAGTSTKYNSGDGISIAVANCNLLQRPLALSPIGSKNAPNQYGLWDMHGNVLEWTEDWAHDNYVGAPKDGSAWVRTGNPSIRVLRGGMFLWDCERARSSARTFWQTSATASGFGFRVALSNATKVY